MSLHKEITFESEICQHLAANGWLYAKGDAANYGRALALYPAAVTGQIEISNTKQPC
jgi:type I restriction enzyme R subunit